jgi:peptidoglycan hydrolase CwlO-like protein
MPLTPEQFDKLVTKEEFNELKDEVKEIGSNVKKILTSVDGIAKKQQTFEVELVSNQAAHDRFEKRIKVLEEK